MATISVTLCALLIAVARAQRPVDDNDLPVSLAGLAEQPNFALNPKLVRNNVLGRPSIKHKTPGLPEYLEDGKCNDVGVQPNFDYKQYEGTWFWSFKIDNPFLGDMEKCISSNLTVNGAGFDVVTTGKSAYNADKVMVGQFRSTEEFADASMSIVFDGVIPANYRILETDYSSYSCVYSCTTTNAFKSEFGFIFTRNPEDAHIAYDKCGTAFIRNGINFAKMKESDQSCFAA